VFSGVKFELLGPVRGWRNGQEIELGSPQQRAVAAMLLTARGRQVPLDNLIDGLWGQDVPKSAVVTTRTYISRMRRCLETRPVNESDVVINCVGDGYALQLRSGVLDVDLFEGWLKGARAARQADEIARAGQLIRNALALWRGTALAGAPGPYAQARRVQLSELHIAAIEEKLAIDIMAEDQTVAIPELRVLLTEHPFREGFAELLMLALYKSGRQAEALGVFDSMRYRLRDELGVDPGPALQQMHQRILRADEGLVCLAGTFSSRPSLTMLPGLFAVPAGA
jgi:DNA-binding SARP family transcriptional activator